MPTVLACVVLAASVRVCETALPTYGFTDPDPVPRSGTDYYPYFRYDGYVANPETRRWQMVEMESDRIKVVVAPEAGGKVWGAYDKKTGVDFIYFNHVAKFRDISMRGPWASGGIEFNFGKMGHAPYTAAPVDWCVRTNADGSVSCFVGCTEWLCRTFWQVEIRLADGDDFFTTHTTWFNASSLQQTYYQWMNAAFHGGDGTRYFYPGLNWIGHGGDVHPWPVENGHDLSRYSQNDIPGYLEDHRAMHVINGDNRWLGVWWPHLNAGALHESRTDEKYGRKIWMWGLSRQGAIWEGLLTDSDGPYVELQSGRGFQQPNSDFLRTPFKFGAFEPGSTDVFSEKWRVVHDENDFSRLDVERSIVPRPTGMPGDFDWDGAYGRYVKGVQRLREGQGFDPLAAEAALRGALGKEPCFAPALDALAGLYVSQGRMEEARPLLRKALAVDTYDDMANYLDGVVAWVAGDLPTARERLGLAAYSPRLRSAALASSARISLAEGKWDEAAELAARSLDGNVRNVDAIAVRIIAARKSGHGAHARRMAEEALRAMPINHLLRFERHGSEKRVFAAGVRSEFPEKTFVELGGWYELSGLRDEALEIYALAPESAIAQTRAAFLRHRAGDEKGADAALAATSGLAVGFDFPFRWESLPAFEWAAGRTGHWKFRYLAALFLASHGRPLAADAMLDACGDSIDDVAALIYRASRRNGTAALCDLKRARGMSDDWRVALGFYHTYAASGDWRSARNVMEEAVRRFPGKLGLELNYARALIKTKNCKEAVAFLDNIDTLPSELGEKPITLYQEALGVLADEALAAGDRVSARRYVEKALSFPETLGAGRPYRVDAVIDRWPRRVADFCRQGAVKGSDFFDTEPVGK